MAGVETELICVETEMRVVETDVTEGLTKLSRLMPHNWL